MTSYGDRCPRHWSFVSDLDGSRRCNFIGCLWHLPLVTNRSVSGIETFMPEQERPKPITDADKAADQMAQDILGGKIDAAGRKVVRKAIDHMDAEPVGKAKSDDALHRISRGG